jgi:hypothetical protein
MSVSNMLTAGGSCLVRSGVYSAGWRIFQRPCEGWTAPSSTSVLASNPIPMKSEGFTRPKSLADSINDALHAQDLVKSTDLPPLWASPPDYLNKLPRDSR